MNESCRFCRHLPLGVLVALLLLVSLQQIYWISAEKNELLSHTVFDDAFYYFQTARNVAQGEGSVSSGGILHNGYHPLWMLLSAGFFGAFDSDMAAIRAILIFGAVLAFLGSLLLYGLLREMECTPWVAVFAVAAFHVNPYMVSMSTGGVEAPLNVMLVVLATWAMIRLRKSPGHWGLAVGFGLLMGLVYLTRTDNAFLVAGAFVYLLARARGGIFWRLVLSGSIAFLVILPWHVWNYLHFGSFMQGSASALPVVRELWFFAQNPEAGEGDLLAFRLTKMAQWFRDVPFFTGLGSFWLVFLPSLLIAAFWKGARDERNWLGRQLTDLLPLLAAVLCLGMAHKFFRLNARHWYFALPDVFMALLLGVGMEALRRIAPLAGRSFPRWFMVVKMIGAFALALLVSMVGRNFPQWYVTIWPVALAVVFGAIVFARRKGMDRPAMARIMVWFCVLVLAVTFLAKKNAFLIRNRQNLANKEIFALHLLDAYEKLAAEKPGAAFGATDSGLIGFFCSRPVVNLDGVVNPEAARAVSEGRLLDYVASLDIRYLTITPRMQNARILGPDWQKRLEPFPPLTHEGFILKEVPESP